MLKEFADDNSKFDENGRKLSKWVENTERKGEIAGYKQFLLFTQCFLKTLLKTGKNQGLFGIGLTHYQTTNFRLFRVERLCRRQFKIRRKWQKVIQTCRKHCG